MHRLPRLDPKTGANDSPHVVILGAGASRAALPDGDRHGRRLPVMATLIDDLGVRDLLLSRGVDLSSGNFEEIYDGLARDPSQSALRQTLEQEVHSYFASLALPEHATLYDALLLSLRKKDVIATFNWDPLLVQAYQRVASLGPMPDLLFLHGNVAVAYCEHDRVAGSPGTVCGMCGGALTPTPLLYPVRDKNYRLNPFIASQWNILEDVLGEAFILTIFGYAAPASDAAARELLLQAWTANKSHELAQVEVIDIRNEDDLFASWDDFFVRSHFGILTRVEHSLIFDYPRRSCDALAGAILMNDPWGPSRVWDPEAEAHLGVHELRARIEPLVSEERIVEATRCSFRRGTDGR